eukprot:2864422-Pyramimonas_sp.AAC.2
MNSPPRRCIHLHSATADRRMGGEQTDPGLTEVNPESRRAPRILSLNGIRLSRGAPVVCCGGNN